MRRGKVLVVGAGEAGKSTLISALSPSAINLSVQGRTVAMDHAPLGRQGWRLSLVGVPGQPRFGPVRHALAVGATAAVWVHRAGEPVDDHSRELIEELGRNGVPYMVVVNHDAASTSTNGWRRPEACPAPRAVISCNLLNPGSDLAHIEECVWDMVTRPVAAEKGD